MSDDRHVRELARCGIPADGALGGFTFRFQNYYWIAAGKVPLAIARELYADPVGRTDIRSGGHCGCPSPDEYGAEYIDAKGRHLFRRKGAVEQAQEVATLDKYVPDWRERYAYVDDPEAECADAFVSGYHIDSELGLYVFVQALRRAGLLPATPPRRGGGE